MDREHSEWTDRFSDYLAGALDGDTCGGLEAHVSQCGPCRLALEEIRDVVARAGGLAEREPTRDLWPGIAAAIRGPMRTQTPGAQVIALPTADETRTPRRPAGITLSAPQLAAAAIVLIAVSVVTTWWVGPGVAVRGVAPLAALDPTPVSLAAELPGAPEGLASELAALEEVLAAAEARLDPNTVRVLQRNLSVIELAIADSRQALALDPDNEYLSEHLERVYERKLAYLRDAARVIDWAG
jgi:anti-sigma factor ChrR (cupin superfamily)